MITPALPLYAMLRRYTLATLGASELAADYAGVLESDMPPDTQDDPVSAQPFETLEVTKRSLVTLPQGWKLSQFRPEQPSTMYSDFKREVIKEIARCLNMPYNVAAGDSSGYNYSSGRLDHQTYFKNVEVERYDIEIKILTRLFKAWCDEAKLVTDLIPEDLVGYPKHVFFWDGTAHVDPLKDAQADSERLKNGTATRAQIYAEDGFDWREKLEEEKEVLEYAKKLGLPWAMEPVKPSNGTPTADPLQERRNGKPNGSYSGSRQ